MQLNAPAEKDKLLNRIGPLKLPENELPEVVKLNHTPRRLPVITDFCRGRCARRRSVAEMNAKAGAQVIAAINVWTAIAEMIPMFSSELRFSTAPKLVNRPQTDQIRTAQNEENLSLHHSPQFFWAAPALPFKNAMAHITPSQTSQRSLVFCLSAVIALGGLCVLCGTFEVSHDPGEILTADADLTLKGGCCADYFDGRKYG